MADLTQFINIQQPLTDFSREVLRQASQNLRIKQRRSGVRAKWRKTGLGWIPTAYKRRPFLANYVATGKLLTSMNATITADNRVIFGMEKYGEYIDLGVKGILQGNPRLAPPPYRMLNWIVDKPVRLRDLNRGNFIKTTPTRRRQASFLIGRKTKWFGMDASYFFTEPFELEFEKLPDDIASMIADQITFLLITHEKNLLSQ